MKLKYCRTNYFLCDPFVLEVTLKNIEPERRLRTCRTSLTSRVRIQSTYSRENRHNLHVCRSVSAPYCLIIHTRHKCTLNKYQNLKMHKIGKHREKQNKSGRGNSGMENFKRRREMGRLGEGQSKLEMSEKS